MFAVIFRAILTLTLIFFSKSNFISSIFSFSMAAINADLFKGSTQFISNSAGLFLQSSIILKCIFNVIKEAMRTTSVVENNFVTLILQRSPLFQREEGKSSRWTIVAYPRDHWTTARFQNHPCLFQLDIPEILMPLSSLRT